LTDSVNSMAGNLTNQVRNIAEVTTAVARGDLSRKITVDVRGEILELKNTINTMVDQLSSFASEVTRVAREVGTEGKLGGQAVVSGVAGTWKDLTESVNSMASNLTNQVRNIAGVTTAVARGDLSTKITVDVRGEILELKNTINTMVDQLNSFASEVTRVAREVGTEGKLGGQAVVTGVAGTWKDLTESVNSMAANLTTQVRGIAKVVTAVANGDLKRKLILETKGEIAELAETINGMIDTLAVFTEQVTSVAREVGIEGKLGGQANVPGAAGLWRDLTNNVNQLAANLTTQVRAIAEVATAVTKGDLTRSITVQAQGEVAALKDTINEMIGNLKETTRKNTEQDWLKTNVARFTRMLQGQRDLMAVSGTVLKEMAPLVEAQHGVFYISSDANGDDSEFKLLASYAYRERKSLSNRFGLGEGLVGQCALEKQRILLTDVPGDYIKINSGLGEAAPLNIVVFPVLFEGDVKAVVELASFHSFSAVHLAFLEQLAESMGIVLNTIEATMRTEELLTQSQALAEELQSQQKELTEGNRRLEEQARTLQASEELLRHQQEKLQHTNSELQEKARLLADQKAEVERKNHEVEQAKEALEEKAEQLALTSKYKSEFLANMSHELRTPLNSLLILAQMLAEDNENRLTGKQVKAAQTIHQSGVELLSLINDILDLSKIESGTILLDLEQVFVTDLKDYVTRTFSHVAEEKGLAFETELGPDLPKTLYTDPRRLQQVLKNLLSNAIKFTDDGGVRLKIDRASGGWRADVKSLNEAETVVVFSIVDTGIGIAEDQQQVIFEAFRQVDGTSSRRYSGTGLGLSICRELAALLGGDIQLESKPGEGSTFSLYLPQNYAGSPASLKRLSSPRRKPETPRETSQQERAGAAHARVVSMVPVEVEDDRHNITPGDRVLLVIEDDPTFARILVDLARQAGFKTVVALWGDRGLALARELKPDAITLDIRLPDMAGWTILDRVRHDPETRQIPIHIISVDEDRRRGLSLGASSYLEKSNSKERFVEVFERILESVERRQRELLIVEPDGERRGRIQEVLVGGDVRSVFVSSGAEAVEAVKTGSFDCVVLGLEMGDIDPLELIESWQNSPETRELPVVVYIDNNLTPEQEHTINRLARHALVRAVCSLDRLLEETAVFLHRVESAMPEESRRKLANMPKDSVIAGGKILVVDDDVRNLFALTSVLERHKLEVLHAEGGPEGLEILKRNPDVDAVLMDIMMPEMDGYETIRQIRQIPEFRGLPVVALTAKAMGGDREKCIEAGASDYITKPVNLDELIWMLRAWMPRRAERRA
ncbi:MAG TPA: response regulator, partial [Bryobacteraceae bacterium]|nr:response regulator [Bryobacteraceae bacterium]